MGSRIQIVQLENRGDARGLSYSAPAESLAFVGQPGDMHLVSAKPGAVRGNHYHLRRREALVVLPGSRWSLHWDEGEQASSQHREFDGSCAVLVLISPGAAHAVRNDGERDLWIVVFSSDAFDPAETLRRELV